MRDGKVKTDRQWQALLRDRERRNRKEDLGKWKSAQAIKEFLTTFGETTTTVPSGYSRDHYFIIHPCVDRKYRWQATAFDSRGPYEDTRDNSFFTLAMKSAGFYKTKAHARMSFPAPEWADWRRAKPASLTRRNPGPVWHLPKKSARFFGDCRDLNGDSINEMKDGSEEISRRTFLSCVKPESMREMERNLGYDRWFRMSTDWHVAYYRSVYENKPVVYFCHSAIEFVFA